MLGIGFFRLILAMTVVVTHTHSLWGFTLGNPVIAVRLFFIISGFYMTLVLREKYKSFRTFWINRAIKIYPIYWLTLVMTILSCVFAYKIRGNWGEMYFLVNDLNKLSLSSQALVLVSQIVIFGRSLVMWTWPQFLLIPQAWTLVLELWFYIMAPYVVTKRWTTVMILMVFSVGIKQWLSHNGYHGDLWEYRFFPSEMVYFLMGTGSYFIYKIIFNFKFLILNKIGWVYLLVAVVALSTFNFWGGPILIREWVFYIVMMGLLPFLFLSSKESRLDRWIGDLSYPVYIVHILVNNIVNPLLIIPWQVGNNWQSLLVLSVSVLWGILLNKLVLYPIEKNRSKMKQ